MGGRKRVRGLGGKMNTLGRERVGWIRGGFGRISMVLESGCRIGLD